MNQGSGGDRTVQARLAFARIWDKKGNAAAAIEAYREVVSLDPAHAEAALRLGLLLQDQLRLDEALEVYKKALEAKPEADELHKQLVNVLILQSGSEAAFRHYGLERQDRRHFDLPASDVSCCTVVRNEMERLPYFLRYHREKGVTAFLAVDNGSTDGTLEYLLAQQDVYVWRSEMSFRRANFGAGFFDPILRRHGQGRWTLIADADELLVYPGCEQRSLRDLCASLDRKNKRAFRAVHLDMYSGISIEETRYSPGEPFQDVCPYFDRRFFHRLEKDAGPYRNQDIYWGGVRQRVFGETGFYLSKVPLLKYSAKCILAGGQHLTNLPASSIASETGCLLHFKYFSSFRDYVAQEVQRAEHADGAAQYRCYANGLRGGKLSLYDPEYSVRLEDSEQLIRLGAMRRDENESEAVRFPEISPVSDSGPRPFWSALITVLRRTQYLADALGSVLMQAPPPEQMEIEVVIEGPEDPDQQAIEAMVRSIGGERVRVHRSTVREGQPEIFNLCLRRARGQWIHILHDDDMVAPGFYASLAAGIEQEPGIGAAFCRHAYIDAQGNETGMSILERGSAGVLENWLDRIAALCRLQTPAIVVKREAYETLGGYCPQARSAYDWEMWQRIAARYPVWFEPKPLARFRFAPGSESGRLAVAGQQIADTRQVIQIVRGYLPEEKKSVLPRRAEANYARAALEIARLRIESGQYESALAHLGEALRCSRSDDVIETLIGLLDAATTPRAETRSKSADAH